MRTYSVDLDKSSWNYKSANAGSQKSYDKTIHPVCDREVSADSILMNQLRILWFSGYV